jgi:SpoVK/Ycf46/Vps4 family AAA+-type ATPase
MEAQTSLLMVQCVRARARRLAMWMARLWALDQSSPDQGLAVTAGEVARILDPGVTSAEREFYVMNAAAAAMSEAIEQADQALADDPGYRALAAAFDLNDRELQLLTLALAVEFDPELPRVLGYLHDDATLVHATPRLAARLFQTASDGPAVAESLLRWRLATPIGDAPWWRQTTPWQADVSLTLSLASGVWRDPTLEGIAECAPFAATALMPCLHPHALEALAELHREGKGRTLQVDLVGPPGIGKQTLAIQFAAAVGKPIVLVEASGLAAAGRPQNETMTAVFRMARHMGAITYWRDSENLDANAWTRARQLGTVILRGRRQADREARAVTLRPLASAERRAAWRHWTDQPMPPQVAAHRLLPAEIVRAARAVRDGFDAVGSALRGGPPPSSDLVQLLPCPYEWDDLVLPANVAALLREFEAQVRLRWAVYEDWGFHRLSHLGHGVTALFGGPSGTGKTMAAQVIARALGLDLYRVDLAGVVNKYIGETEKRLRDVFELCERTGVLLFFDEADALFGQRTQVKDSHDRFANIEIDYLLQRIERFDGITVLATNRKNDLDPAFLRRLRFVVDFLPPGPAERLALWKRSLHSNAPSGEPILDEIDFDHLARLGQMTGADIKAAALGAAFLAKAEGVPIGMRHVLGASQRELTKQGAVLRMPLREVAR